MLLIIEGLGFLLGYMVGFYAKEIDMNDYALRRRTYILAAISFAIVAIAGGLMTYAYVLEIDNKNTLKDHILGFLLLTLPGVGAGMFTSWLTEKFSGVK